MSLINNVSDYYSAIAHIANGNSKRNEMNVGSAMAGLNASSEGKGKDQDKRTPGFRVPHYGSAAVRPTPPLKATKGEGEMLEITGQTGGKSHAIFTIKK